LLAPWLSALNAGQGGNSLATIRRESAVTVSQRTNDTSNVDIYESQAEQQKHEQAMEALAEEFGSDIYEVQQMYERAYITLKSQATVKDYLPLLVTRHTRALLRERRRK
jgi:hypothetical protein